MDADDFWRNQLIKNKVGAAKYAVETDADTPEEALMRSWIEKWHKQLFYFDNDGCGCCVNFYKFDAPQEAVSEIPISLLKVL